MTNEADQKTDKYAWAVIHGIEYRKIPETDNMLIIMGERKFQELFDMFKVDEGDLRTKEEGFLLELKSLLEKYQIKITSLDGYNYDEVLAGTYYHLSSGDGEIYIEWDELLEELLKLMPEEEDWA